MATILSIVGGSLVVATAPPPTALSGVYVGGTNTTTVDDFGTWRGKPVDVLHTFPSRASWTAIESPADATSLQGTSYANTKWMPSVGMLPNSGGLLSDGAAGTFDSHWTNLATWLVSTGHASCWLRFGWEFNLSTFLWSINPGAANSGGVDQTSHFVAYWIRIVNAMRAAGFTGKFVWAPSSGSNATLPDPSLAYPGDAYVDAIMPDNYDKWFNHPASTVTPASRWNFNLTSGGRGLTFWLSFAETHNKIFGLAEWGLWDTLSLSGSTPQGGGGDDPTYFDNVSGLLASARTSGLSTLELYFNADAGDGSHKIHPVGTTDFHLAAAEYQVKFG
jgi:hypothetical protein